MSSFFLVALVPLWYKKPGMAVRKRRRKLRKVLRDAGTGRFITRRKADSMPKNQWIEELVRRHSMYDE